MGPRAAPWGGLLCAMLLWGGLLAAATAVRAEDAAGGHRGNSGPYVGIRAISAAAFAEDVRTKGFRGARLIENDEDGVAGPALLVGYVVEPFPARLEVEAGYRMRFDLDVRDVDAPGGTVDYENNLSSIQVLVNLVLQWRNDSALTPFAGGTLGWVRNRVETQRTVLDTGAQINTEENSNNIAWGLIAGVEWGFTGNWSAEAAYRFIDLGQARTVVFAGGDRIETDSYVSHDVLLTLNYHF